MIIDILNPSNRFYRSVQLERDFHDNHVLDHYVCTDLAQEHIQRILEGLRPGSGLRAWRLTGDYGCGKSSLAVVLARVLCRKKGKRLPKAMRDFAKAPQGATCSNFFPVLITGSREPLSNALLNGVARAISAADVHGTARLVRKLRKVAGQVLAGRDAEVSALIDSACKELVEVHEYSGVLLILDELGKFLEYATQHPERQDVYLLQLLAESAARSGAQPLAVLGILHQGIGEYAKNLPAATRQEWKKIAGRFEELVFEQSLNQQLVLTSEALGTESTPASLQPAMKQAAKRIEPLGWYGSTSAASLFQGGTGIYPLHLTVLPAIIRIFRRFGQNERSLFGFLFSGEPHGLMHFANNHSVGEFYRLENFYDYVENNLSHVLRREPRCRWAQIQTHISQYDQADDVGLAILKTIGVLNLLDADGLFATTGALLASLQCKRLKKRVIEQALAEIVTRGVLYQRGERGGFCLWPHTSVNLGQRMEAAQEAVKHVGSLVRKLVPHLSSRPQVTRRHYIETGNLRYFAVEYVDAPKLGDWEASDEEVIVVVLCETGKQRDAARKALKKRKDAAESGILFSLPQPLGDLRPMVVEVDRWKWVADSTKELAGDSFAKKEVDQALQGATRRLADVVKLRAGLYEFTEESEIEWFCRGKQCEGLTRRDLMLSRLSEMVDDRYPKCPIVHNELVNRRQISSAAAAARMRLIERVFSSSHLKNMGLGEGGKRPPEMSMYFSVLKASGIHTNANGKPRLRVPEAGNDPCNFRAIFMCMRDWLATSPDERLPVTELQAELERPPYGLLPGLFMLVLAIFCQINRREIAMYEDETFITELSGDHFLRMVKQIDRFELQYCEIKGLRVEVFDQLLELLDPDGKKGGDVNVLDVVRPLLGFVAGLPPYTRKTRRLSEVALKVRKALVKAKEPGPLLFEQLPVACGLQPIDAHDTSEELHSVVEMFISRLRAAMYELREAYPKVLVQICTGLSNGFEFGELPVNELRGEIGPDAGRLAQRLYEPRIKGFCSLLSSKIAEDNAWLEALGSFVCATPPRQWSDLDNDRFTDELLIFVKRYQQARSLAHARGWQDASEKQSEAVRVSLMREDGTELDQVVTFSSGEAKKVADLEKKIHKLLPSGDPRLGLAAISRALWAVLEQPEQRVHHDV